MSFDIPKHFVAFNADWVNKFLEFQKLLQVMNSTKWISLVEKVYVEYLPLGVGTHKGTNGITLQKDFESF